MVINFLYLMGWIGAFLLAICGLPQAIKTLHTRRFDGLSLSFVTFWFFGELFTFLYIILSAFSWPLFFNYSVNLLICSIILEVYIIEKVRKHNLL